jgi:hypothetical protein
MPQTAYMSLHDDTRKLRKFFFLIIILYSQTTTAANIQDAIKGLRSRKPSTFISMALSLSNRFKNVILFYFTFTAFEGYETLWGIFFLIYFFTHEFPFIL